MKPRTKTSLLAGAVFVVVLVGGFFVGTRVAGHYDAEMISALQVADAALTTTRYVQMLEALRDGKHEAVIERLETDLDFTLIHLAGEYSPARDYYGSGAKSLALARKYRAAHPRSTTLVSVDHQVQAALAMKTASPPPR